MMHTRKPGIGPWLTTLAGIALLAAATGTAQKASHQAFVANVTANTVSVIDTTTNAVTGTIDVGRRPAEVVLSTDGALGFVMNTGSQSISVFETASQDIVATIALGEEPSGMAVASARDRVYVLGVTGLFEVIDTAHILEPANRIIESFRIGESGGRVAVTPDGTRVYVASSALWIVDTATNEVLPRELGPAGESFPVAVSISPDGKSAYVSVVIYSFDVFGFRADGAIKVVDVLTDQVTASIPLYSQPGAVAFAPDGKRAYVSIRSYWASTGYGAAFLPGRWVAAIDTATSAVVEWIDVGGVPAGLAVTPDRTSLDATIPGSLYATIPGNDEIAAIDLTTNAVIGSISILNGAPTAVTTTPGSAAPPRPATPRAAVVDAVDDAVGSPLVALAGGVAASNVLANDTIDGAPAAVGNVTLSLSAVTHPGLTLDTSTGALSVSADTPAGGHGAAYRICEASNAGNCDDASVTLTVRAPYVIAAAADRATAAAGAGSVANVIANDTRNGAPADFANVFLSLVSGDEGLRFDAATGWVSVTDAAVPGEHALVYRACDIASPANCDQATATVLVLMPVIQAAADSGSAPRTGAVGTVNVLANDTLDGSPVALSRITLARVSSTDPGVSLNAATGAIAVASGTEAGVHTVVYRLCEAVRPDNCSEAAATITVSQSVVTAAPDSARASNKSAANAVVNVLANDRIGGVRATAANATVSQVSLSPANRLIRLNADGTVDVLGRVSGSMYSLIYEVCEAESPANCARATLRLEFSGRN